MIDHYQAYLEAPSQDGFLKLQAEVQQETDYCAAGSFVDRLADLCQRGRYEAMLQETELMPFAWIASPSAHLYAAIAAEQCGCPDDAELERFVTESLLHGLLATGRGTIDAPYRLTYLSDRQDLLAYFSASVEKQNLARCETGLVDIVTTHLGDQLCFRLDGPLTTARVEQRSQVRPNSAHPRLASKRLAACAPRRVW